MELLCAVCLRMISNGSVFNNLLPSRVISDATTGQFNTNMLKACYGGGGGEEDRKKEEGNKRLFQIPVVLITSGQYPNQKKQV